MGSLCALMLLSKLVTHCSRHGSVWGECSQIILKQLWLVPPVSSGETVMSSCFNAHLQESGHIFQKFSDAKTLSVSDKLLNFFRFPMTFTLEEPYISRKKHVVHTGTAKQRETTDSGGSFSKRLTWLGSEIRLSLAQRSKVTTGSGLS